MISISLEGKEQSMDQTLILGIVAAGALAFWGYQRNSRGGRQLKIDPETAKERLDREKGIILLDVRTPDEYKEKHIPKATLIPLNELAREASQKLPDKEADIIVYCHSGSRSRVAVRILLKQGYTNVWDLGGIMHWPYKTVSGNRKK